MLQLVVEPPATAAAKGKQILNRAQRSPTSISSAVVSRLCLTFTQQSAPISGNT